MKNLGLGLIVAMLLAVPTLQAETLMGTFQGKLRGSDTRDVHTLDLKSGAYRYTLKLTGSKKAKTRFRIKKRQLSGIILKKLDKKGLKNRRTHKGNFSIAVNGVVGQPTNGTREGRFILSKKAGPRQVNYVLKIYKK